jgi:ubiquinone/menaquinone biosynthesis C-methylase UbiE
MFIALTIATHANANNYLAHKDKDLIGYLNNISYHIDEKAKLVEYLKSYQHPQILEVGIGGGESIEYIIKHAQQCFTIYGIDISSEVVKIVQEKFRRKNYLNDQCKIVKLMVASATNLKEIQDSSIDIINVSAVLHEIYSYAGGYSGLDKFFRESCRVQQKDGLLFYRDPELSENYKQNVQLVLSTKLSRYFVHFFLEKFLDSAEQKVAQIEVAESGRMSVAKYISLPIAKFNQETKLLIDNKLAQEVERHFLVFLKEIGHSNTGLRRTFATNYEEALAKAIKLYDTTPLYWSDKCDSSLRQMLDFIRLEGREKYYYYTASQLVQKMNKQCDGKYQVLASIAYPRPEYNRLLNQHMQKFDGDNQQLDFVTSKKQLVLKYDRIY